MDNSATLCIEDRITKLERDRQQNNDHIAILQSDLSAIALENQDIDADIENLRAALTVLSI